jgi:hypothetical protein
VLSLSAIASSAVAQTAASRGLPRRPGGFAWSLKDKSFESQCVTQGGSIANRNTSTATRALRCTGVSIAGLPAMKEVTAFWLRSAETAGRMIVGSKPYFSSDEAQQSTAEVLRLLEASYGPGELQQNRMRADVVVYGWIVADGEILMAAQQLTASNGSPFYVINVVYSRPGFNDALAKTLGETF